MNPARRLAAGWILLARARRPLHAGCRPALAVWTPGLAPAHRRATARRQPPRILSAPTARPRPRRDAGRGARRRRCRPPRRRGIGVLFGVPLGLLAAARGGCRSMPSCRASTTALRVPRAAARRAARPRAWGPAPQRRPSPSASSTSRCSRASRAAARQASSSATSCSPHALSGVGGARHRPTHILAQVAPLVIVQATMQLAMAVGAEARSPMSASACSRRRRAGAACSTTRRPIWTCPLARDVPGPRHRAMVLGVRPARRRPARYATIRAGPHGGRTAMTLLSSKACRSRSAAARCCESLLSSGCRRSPRAHRRIGLAASR